MLRRKLASTLALATLVCAAPARGQELLDEIAEPSVHARPVLCVIHVAQTPEDDVRERRFLRELSRVLDELDVELVDPGDDDFPNLTLAAQVERVRPLVARRHAVAAAWIARPSPEMMMLHLVALSTGRALVRLVEARAEPKSEAALALITRELLGTAFLFEEAPKRVPPEIVRVVQVVREQAAPAPVVWLAFAGAQVNGGIAGQSGPSTLVGGELGAERALPWNLSARLAIELDAGPWRGGAVPLTGWSISARLDLARLWQVGPLRLGPDIGIEAGSAQIDFHFTSADDAQVSRALLRIHAGLDLRWAFWGDWQLFLRAGLGVDPEQRQFTRRSDGSLLYRTPILRATASLGLVVPLSR